MTIKQLIDAVAAVKPTGWTYYAGHTAEAYNTERVITSTMVLVVPNPYPLWWRDNCEEKVQLKLLYLPLVDVYDTTTTGTQQHIPWSSAEDRAALYDTVRTSVIALSNVDYITVTAVAPVKFYDSPDGPTVNRQLMAEVNISVTLTKKPV